MRIEKGGNILFLGIIIHFNNYVNYLFFKRMYVDKRFETNLMRNYCN